METLMIPKRRLYYFTPPDHALENLEKKRLKVSRFSQCNDPFELAAFSFRDKKIRKKCSNFLNMVDQKHGLLCLCKSWRNPVMWGHYARNHTGICYGFDIDATKAVDVRYVSQRLHPNHGFDDLANEDVGRLLNDLFATKFLHWSYEEEVRLSVNFKGNLPLTDLAFHRFSNEMELKEVIVGPNSSIKVSDVKQLVPNPEVEVFKSRLAFRRFEVVRQKNKAYW